ncbi:hypothetical protein JHW43_001030 [Diplocarpon mali]|nr:hypothetical protein JHW43_001030 [Diplocarpon mali]
MRLGLARATGDGTCPSGSGKVYYVCSNGFKGCCSVEVCDLPSCPDEDSSLATATGATMSESATRKTLISMSTSTLPSTPATATTPSLVTTPVISDVSTPTPSSSQTSSPSSSSSSTPAPSPGPGKSIIPIIAGSVGGVAAISIILVLIWYVLRSRKEKRDIQPYDDPGLPKHFILNRSPTAQSIPVGARDDCFAPFGGRYNEPRHPATLPTSVPPDSQEIATSATEVDHFTAPSRPRPLLDGSLPDSEKFTISPLSAHEHASFHAVPGQPSSGPTLSTETSTSSPPNRSTLAARPTYVVSYPREHATFQPAVDPASDGRRQSSFVPSPALTSSSQQSHPPAWRCSELSAASPLTSPVLGRSELEAAGPAPYHAPRSPAPGSRRANDAGNPVSRDAADGSARPTPAGLGLESSSPPELPEPRGPPEGATQLLLHPQHVSNDRDLDSAPLAPPPTQSQSQTQTLGPGPSPSPDHERWSGSTTLSSSRGGVLASPSPSPRPASPSAAASPARNAAWTALWGTR